MNLFIFKWGRDPTGTRPVALISVVTMTGTLPSPARDAAGVDVESEIDDDLREISEHRPLLGAQVRTARQTSTTKRKDLTADEFPSLSRPHPQTMLHYSSKPRSGIGGFRRCRLYRRLDLGSREAGPQRNRRAFSPCRAWQLGQKHDEPLRGGLEYSWAL